MNLLKKVLQKTISLLLNIGYRENGAIKHCMLVKVQNIEMLCSFLVDILWKYLGIHNIFLSLLAFMVRMSVELRT